METRRWILEIDQGIDPPKGYKWQALADEMRFGESHEVETKSNAQGLYYAINRQSNAQGRMHRVKDGNGKHRVWKLKKDDNE